MCKLFNIEYKNINLLNYEKMVIDTFNFNWYTDDTHSSYNGAKAFSKLINEIRFSNKK